MSGAHGEAKIGPVFAFTERRGDVERFYREVLGLAQRSTDPDAAWFTTANADIVVRGHDDRELPPEVARSAGFVVWFGVAHVDEAWRRARESGVALGEFRGDHFFAKDPDGRFVGVYEEHDHGHGHDH